MKIKKGFLILTGLSMLTLMVMSVGILNRPAQAAEEPAAELEVSTSAEETAIPACTPDANGMRAYWQFEDGPAATSFVDSVENPAFNNGACVGAACPSSTASGKVGSAFNFDGNDEIHVADTTGLEFTLAGDMSVETWVKTTQSCENRVVFVGRWEANPGAAWWLGCMEGDVAAFHMRDSDNKAVYVKGTSVINDGQWHHIVGTWDGTENKIYVDGVLEKTEVPAFTGTLSFNAKDITIGHLDRPTPGYGLNGTLDEMVLYDQALSAEDISGHYGDCTIDQEKEIYLPVIVKGN